MSAPTLGKSPLAWRDAELLRCYLGSTDRVGGEPAYDWLVQTAQRLGLPGATVTHGSVGFGQGGQIHRACLFAWSPDLPVVVECVAPAAQVQRLALEVARALPEALLTRHPVRSLAWEENR